MLVLVILAHGRCIVSSFLLLPGRKLVEFGGEVMLLFIFFVFFFKILCEHYSVSRSTESKLRESKNCSILLEVKIELCESCSSTVHVTNLSLQATGNLVELFCSTLALVLAVCLM